MSQDNKINILLVDDRPENLLTLEAIIERDDYHLVKASSGEEALKYLLKYEFAAVLLDVQMPGIDGFGTAKIIKSREKTKNVPILFITANNLESEHIFTGYSIGAIDYILKPFDPFILKAKVEGFVQLYKMNQTLIQQAKHLREKAKELENANEIISHMAYHDGLTDLPNRRYFQEQLSRRIHEAREANETLVLMYLNMDRFKSINDSLGHTIGDKVLQGCANKLVECIPKSGFIARVGGDEFHILLSNTDREQALDIAEKILDAFKIPFHIANYELFISICIGISLFPYDGEDPQLLSKSADAALYRAKEQGKNQYRVFHSGMNIQSYRSFMMQSELRKAIEREEFALVYHPRMDITTGEIISVEAAIRWEHSSWGTLLPEEFIPLAEETGQIIELGKWLLKSALQQSQVWLEKGLKPIRIAVNVSPQQFLCKGFVDTIQTLLAQTTVKPNQFEITITESALMGNEMAITKILHQLRKMGVHICIDQFGKGYFSLSYLKSSPVNILKIDKSFIYDTPSPISINLLSTIISFSRSLNMKVIVDGVATEEQGFLLSEQLCDELQGDLVSPPLSAEQFEALLLENQKRMTSNGNGKITFISDKKTVKKDTTTHPISDNDQNELVLKLALDHIRECYSLSTREMDVFELLVKGLYNKEISDKLFISEHTVKNHITRIFQKLTVNDRLQAIAKVYQVFIDQGSHYRVQ